MGNWWKSLKKTLSHNHTLKFLADPVKPVEKLAAGAYHDGKKIVKYTGKHVIADVDGISSSISSSLPLIIGGVVVVMMMKK